MIRKNVYHPRDWRHRHRHRIHLCLSTTFSRPGGSPTRDSGTTSDWTPGNTDPSKPRADDCNCCAQSRDFGITWSEIGACLLPTTTGRSCFSFTGYSHTITSSLLGSMHSSQELARFKIKSSYEHRPGHTLSLMTCCLSFSGGCWIGLDRTERQFSQLCLVAIPALYDVIYHIVLYCMHTYILAPVATCFSFKKAKAAFFANPCIFSPFSLRSPHQQKVRSP